MKPFDSLCEKSFLTFREMIAISIFIFLEITIEKIGKDRFL